MRAHGVRIINQIVHVNRNIYIYIYYILNIYRSTTPPPLAQMFVIRMLTRDLSAVANFIYFVTALLLSVTDRAEHNNTL